ncbi:hypothetical protein JCM8547_001929 [Rhodosporidiobolus lusitaniae]
MASALSSTPPSAHSHTRPSHSRRASALTDTPTPSSHNSIPPSSSIRPMASVQDLGAAALKRRATLASQTGNGLRAGSPNLLNRDRPSSRLSKSSLFDSELEALAEPIQRDNTELDRINKENSIQRIIGDLQNDRISLSSASSAASRSSAGELEQERRRDFADEESDDGRESSASSASRSSLSSFRIGMAGRQANVDPLEPLDAPSEDDITYVTLPRSVDSPAASPYKSPAVAPPARTTTAGGLFGSPRPLTAAPAASSPLRPSTRHADENTAPPAPSSAPAFRRSPFASSPQSYPTVPPLSTRPTFLRSPAVAPATAQPTSRPSPLNPQVNSPVLGNSPTATYSRSGSGSGTYGHRANHSLSSAASATKKQSLQRSREQGREEDLDAADRTAFSSTTIGGGAGGPGGVSYRLPNATVLTEALGSPEKQRLRAQMRKGPSPVRSAATGSSGAASSGKSGEANLLTTALSTLTARLAALERENAASSARVHELEVAASSAAAAQQQEADVLRLRREIDSHLAEERERRAELEKVVQSLRAQNTHLDRVLEQQHSDHEAFRRAAAAPPPPVQQQQQQHETHGDELRIEVADLKTGLEVLGYEVDGVRTVVEELLRDKEEREAGRKWEAEEEERRRLYRSPPGGQVDEDLDRTPRPKRTAAAPQRARTGVGEGTFDVPGTPPQEDASARSWVSADEISRLRAEQDLETSRRTPRTSRRKTAKTADLPPRPSSAPLHRSHRHVEIASSATEDDASYRPSTATFDGESVSYSQPSSFTLEEDEEQYNKGGKADEEDASTLYEEQPKVLPPLPASRSQAAAHAKHRSQHREKELAVLSDEPDFARADQIFADVSRATEHSPRRRQQQQKRAARHSSASKRDRVVLVEEPSVNLCSNCHGRKKGLEHEEKERRRTVEKEKEVKEKKEKEKERARRKEEEQKEAARRREREREDHRRTLEGVLERLEEEFKVQKKIYLELTAEYQSMSSRHKSGKRHALATHLKRSIDVLEDKARDVKQYADALDNLYDAVHVHACPSTTRKRHAVV